MNAPEPTPPALPDRPVPNRGWVWRATLATKAAGKISVLAVVETVLACAAYWWIAFHYDTHWHLLTSILIAPLLLLRSPESIQKGVDWVLWEGFKRRDTWSQGRRTAWGAIVLTPIVLTGVWLFHGLEVWASSYKSSGWGWWVLLITAGAVLVMAISVAVGFGVAIAFVGSGSGADTARRVRNTVTDVFSAVCIGPGVGLGWLLRSLGCRFAATLRHLYQGWRCMPDNWRENNLLTDSTLPPELLPGIRDREEFFALEGLLKRRNSENGFWLRMVFYPLVALVMFVPAFLYRLSIKGTAWFWWPLAFLLKPVPPEDEESGEKDRLTWPWRNPWQKTWTWLCLLLALVTLPAYFVSVRKLLWSLLSMGNKVEGVPFAARLMQAVGWDAVRPWHWAAALMAACSLAMLIIAGRAVQKDENGHWSAYRQKGLRRDLWCMDMLKRVRFLATIFFWLVGLTALLLETKMIPEKIPLPSRQTEALRAWFAGKAAP